MHTNGARMYLLEFNPVINPDSVEQQQIPLQLLNINQENADYNVPALYTKEIDPPQEVENFIDSYIDGNEVYNNYVSSHEESHTYVKIEHAMDLVTENCQPSEEVNKNIQHQKISVLTSNNPTATYAVSGVSVNIVRYSQLESYVNIPDTEVQPRAIAVLPKVLQLRRDGISPRRMLPARVRFGPVQGIKCKVSQTAAQELISQAAISMKPIFLSSDDDSIFHIDMSDKDKCNWFSLLPLGDQRTANVWLVLEHDELYGITLHAIPPRTKLCLGYTREYADCHSIPADQPILDHNEVKLQEVVKWWCHECQRSVSSAARLKRHIDICHKEAKRKPRRRYRCQHCEAVFSGMYTLKRHMTKFCTKKPEKSDTAIESNSISYAGKTTVEINILPDAGETVVESNSLPNARKTVECNSISETGLNTTLNIEDDRLPSDESFNNYTNGLDFSTNLFDTDRMPNLDISGSSRSETDLNPYSGSNRVDNYLINGSDLTKISNESEIANTISMDKTIKTEILTTFSCIHCKKTFHSKIKRRHIRDCLRQKYGCQCGRRFLSKEKLAQHIFAEHHVVDKKSPLPAGAKDVNESNDISYGCEQCQLSFKRRGMLVNHLWRVHGAAAGTAAAPLQRRERVFPCVACPKLYRSAAKRAAHVRTHHPGADIKRAKWIESGRRACEPAACSACPRQYATRAKLLQHIRAHHPLLAPPTKKKSMKLVN